MQILHVSLTPAQVSLDEFRQAGRVLLPAFELVGDYTHLVSGPAHQDRLYLVMAQDVTAQRRAARQDRQPAVGKEGIQADDGIVAPVGPARSLPPGDSERMKTHAVTHAELEDSGEGAA